MLLLEHDAKELIAKAGIPVPEGVLVDSFRALPRNLGFPCFLKAQVPVGGRGKAGGIVRATNRAEVTEGLERLFDLTIKGHAVRSCRIEAPADGKEAYVALMLDAASGTVRVIASERGGVDIEGYAADGGVASTAAAFDRKAVAEALVALAADMSADVRSALTEAAPILAARFFELNILLLEINPLFVKEDGSWLAGDAKIAVDLNALERQPLLDAMFRARLDDYPAVRVKLEQGFDFLKLDADGDIGLVTTGAGLSMQLVDEISARGHRPYNFCDIRTGQFRGDPSRLIQVLRWIAEGPNIRSVLMNFFAGITHLGELADLLVHALRATPELKAPVTIRMIGNGLDEAIAKLASSRQDIRIETDLEVALDGALEGVGSSRP